MNCDTMVGKVAIGPTKDSARWKNCEGHEHAVHSYRGIIIQ